MRFSACTAAPKCTVSTGAHAGPLVEQLARLDPSPELEGVKPGELWPAFDCPFDEALIDRMEKSYLRTQNTQYPFHTAYQKVQYPELATGPLYQGYTPSRRYTEPVSPSTSSAGDGRSVSFEQTEPFHPDVHIERAPVAAACDEFTAA